MSEIKLERPASRIKARILAHLSRYDLTPLLFKKRFFDPVLLGITRNSLYVFLRKLFYKNVSFSSSKKGACCSLYAFVGGKHSAKAVLHFREGQGVVVSSYVRHRDRNPMFAKKFMKRIIEVAAKEYGAQYKVHVTDPVLESLIDTNHEIM